MSHRLARGGSASLRLAWDPLRIGVFALTLVTISRVHQHFSFLKAARPALVLFAFVALYAFLNPRLLGDGRWLRTWPAKVVVALGVLACVSAPFGISLGAAAVFILDSYSKVLVFTFVLMAMVRGARDVYLLTWAYVISSGILVIMALFLFDMSHYDGYARLGNLYKYDANDLGLVLLVGLGLTLLALQVARGAGRITAVLILLGIGMAIAKSGSRGAFVGLVAVGAFLLFSLSRVPVAKRLGIVAAAVLALAIGAPPGYWQQMNTITEPTQDYNWESPTGRRQVFMRGVGYMLRYPVFGIGINNFPRAEGTISDRAKGWMPGDRGIKWVAPHNSYIQAGSELGIPGLALFLSLVVGGIVGMRRLHRRLPPSWEHGDAEERFLYHATVYLPVALVGFAAPAFFVSFAYGDPIYYLTAMVVGVYVSIDAKLRALAPATTGGPRFHRSAVPRRAAVRALGPVSAVAPIDATSR